VTHILLIGDEKSPLYKHVINQLEREPVSLVQLSAASCNAEMIEQAWSEKDFSLVLDLSVFSVDPPADLLRNTEVLAKACSAKRAVLLHISSHEVFGGENKTTYNEEDQPAPTTVDGQRVWDTERAVQLNADSHIILRLSWLTSGSSDNVFTRLLNRLSQPGEVRASSDLRGAPTFTDDAARVIVALVKQVFAKADNWGVYHYTSSDPCSEWEFAECLRQILQSQDQPVAELVDVSTGEFEPSAVLSCRRCRDDFGVQQRSWRQGLEARIRSWLKSKSN
jgi:dTDP-4-dehydrorhamnose reductase